MDGDQKAQAQEKAPVVPQLPNYGIPVATRQQIKPLAKMLTKGIKMRFPKGIIRPSTVHITHKKRKGSYIT